jgi:hypothetical protein
MRRRGGGRGREEGFEQGGEVWGSEADLLDRQFLPLVVAICSLHNSTISPGLYSCDFPKISMHECLNVICLESTGTSISCAHASSSWKSERDRA